MLPDPVFRAQKVVPNRFLLSVLTFERAKQLIRGARLRSDRRYFHPVTNAVEEIATGHVKPGDDGDERHWKLG